MATPTTFTTPVKPLIRDWRFGQDMNGYVGTRLYITGTNNDPGVEELPVIGESWDATYVNVTVKRIDVTFTCERNNTYKTYVISYDSYVVANPSYTDDTNNMSELPISIDLSSDFTTFTNPEGTSPNFWYWKSAPNIKITGETFIKPNPQESFIITRNVYGSNLEKYHEIARKCIMKVNKEEMMKFPKETVRFDGAQFDEIANNARSSERKWKVQLKFTAKLAANLTWQMDYNPTNNTFEERLFAPLGTKAYEEEDLKLLFTFGQSSLGADPVFPNQ